MSIVHEGVLKHEWAQLAIDFGARRNVPQNAFAKPVHLAFAYLLNHSLRFLCRMHSKCPKEARHSGEASGGRSLR